MGITSTLGSISMVIGSIFLLNVDLKKRNKTYDIVGVVLVLLLSLLFIKF
jgi:hypothetical protein